MSKRIYSLEQIREIGRLTWIDQQEIKQRRLEHNQLGFAYQLAFVRLTNRFPHQHPLELLPELLLYISEQLHLNPQVITAYAQRQPTIAEHRQRILVYLEVRYFESDNPILLTFLFQQACRLEQLGPLMALTQQYLRQQKILSPTDEVLRRLIVKQRQAAEEHIYQQIMTILPVSAQVKMDELLETQGSPFSPLHFLKQPPGRPSPTSILRLTTKLKLIHDTQILTLDLSWLNNNYQRALARHVQQRSATRLKLLQPEKRYALLTCFLSQLYADSLDFLIEMYDKLLTQLYNRTENRLEQDLKQRRKATHHSLETFHLIGTLLLDDSIADEQLRQTLFTQVDKQLLAQQIRQVHTWLTDKQAHVFYQVSQRYSYLRQFSPAFLEAIEWQTESNSDPTLLQALSLLRHLNQTSKRKLPENAPLEFMPKKIRQLLEKQETLDKREWECALLTRSC